jgi:hypothetical protein
MGSNAYGNSLRKGIQDLAFMSSLQLPEHGDTHRWHAEMQE